MHPVARILDDQIPSTGEASWDDPDDAAGGVSVCESDTLEPSTEPYIGPYSVAVQNDREPFLDEHLELGACGPDVELLGRCRGDIELPLRPLSVNVFAIDQSDCP